LAEQFFDVSQSEISSTFGRRRHFAKRAKAELTECLEEPNKSPYQKQVVNAYNRILLRMKAYVAFKAKTVDNKDEDQEAPRVS